jgi:hypothetical protein
MPYLVEQLYRESIATPYGLFRSKSLVLSTQLAYLVSDIEFRV